MQVRRIPIDSVAAALRHLWRQVFMTSETEMTLIVGGAVMTKNEVRFDRMEATRDCCRQNGRVIVPIVSPI